MNNFEFVKASFNQAMNTPKDQFFSENGVNAYSVLIPWCREYCKKVFFVDDNSGNEFGQFSKKNDSLSLAIEMSKLFQSERNLKDR